MSLSRLHEFKFHKEDFTPILKNIVDRVTKAAPECEVYIFGSFVTGCFTGESDLDIAVIHPDNQKKKILLEDIYKPGHLSEWPLDLILISKSDYQKKKDIGGVSFDIQETGIQLYPIWNLYGTK